MGTCYRLIMTEACDWAHVDYSKRQLIQDVKAKVPHAEVLCDAYFWLVLNIGKVDPVAFYGKFRYDTIWYSVDLDNFTSIRRVDKPEPGCEIDFDDYVF